MRKYLLIILCCFLLQTNKSNAQAALGISQYSYVLANDTVLAFSSTDSIGFYVVNKGTANFNDVFTVYMAVQDSGATTYHNVDSAFYFFPAFIPPGDSIPFSIHPYYITNDSTKYHYDINVIVIWPVALTAPTIDSLMFNIMIFVNTSVQEINLNSYITAYPNPTTNNLMLQNSSQKSIEEVRIYDTLGRLIQTEKNTSFICTDTWKAGTYLIKIQLENKETRTIRVIKQ